MSESQIPVEPTTEAAEPEDTAPTAAVQETPEPQPRVWTASNAQAPLTEPPARGIRVGQLVWACIVVLAGVFLMMIPLIDVLDVPLLAIGLVAVLGVAFIVAAFLVGKPSTGGTTR